MVAVVFVCVRTVRPLAMPKMRACMRFCTLPKYLLIKCCYFSIAHAFFTAPKYAFGHLSLCVRCALSSNNSSSHCVAKCRRYATPSAIKSQQRYPSARISRSACRRHPVSNMSQDRFGRAAAPGRRCRRRRRLHPFLVKTLPSPRSVFGMSCRSMYMGLCRCSS